MKKLIALLLVELLENYSSGYYGIWDNIPLCMLILGAGIFVIALLVIGFLFAMLMIKAYLLIKCR